MCLYLRSLWCVVCNRGSKSTIIVARRLGVASFRFLLTSLFAAEFLSAPGLGFLRHEAKDKHWPDVNVVVLYLFHFA